MSVMAFDTLAAAKRLKTTVMSDEQAEAIVGTLSQAVSEGVATKLDIAELRGEIRQVETGLRGEIQEGRAELRGEIKEVRAELLVLKWMMGVVVAGVLATVIRLYLVGP